MTKRGVKTGAKLPSSYDGGTPAVNLLLAVLNKSKQENAVMWIDFKKTELYEDGVSNIPDGLEIAWWVSEYLNG